MNRAGVVRLGSRVVLVVGWTITAVLGGLVLARVVAYDRGRILLVANSLTYWIFLPAYLVLAVGHRRPRARAHRVRHGRRARAT